MLVLNRRPGESIVVEHGIRLTVLSVADHKVWLVLEAPGLRGPVHLSAAVLSEHEVRLEVGAPSAARIGDGGVCLELSPGTRGDRPAEATLSLLRQVGTSVAVVEDVDAAGAPAGVPPAGEVATGDGAAAGERLRITVASVAKGNPCLRLTGPSIGFPLDVTVLRAVGSYVRVGIDAPAERRVYRKELWDDMVAANRAAAGGEGDDLSALVAGRAIPRQEPVLPRPAAAEPAAGRGASPAAQRTAMTA